MRTSTLTNPTTVRKSDAYRSCYRSARDLCEQWLNLLRIEFLCEPGGLARRFPGMPQESIAPLGIAPFPLGLGAECSKASDLRNIYHAHSGLLNSAIPAMAVLTVNRLATATTEIFSTG